MIASPNSVRSSSQKRVGETGCKVRRSSTCDGKTECRVSAAATSSRNAAPVCPARPARISSQAAVVSWARSVITGQHNVDVGLGADDAFWRDRRLR